MNPSVTIPQSLGVMNVGEMLALPGLVSEKKAKATRLSVSAQELFRNVAATLDELVLRTIGRRTPNEFRSTREEVFPKYFEGTLGLAFLARAVVPGHVLEVLNIEYFSEMEAEFRDQGLTAFGAAVRDQAVFTVWTLRKISELCLKIADAPKVSDSLKKKVSDSLKKDDMDAFGMFANHSMRTRFHLDCLLKSMLLRKPIYPEVLEVIIDGLRSAVNAYAWARRALDLRVPILELDIPLVAWDDEDQQLLNEATYDMIEESV